MYSGVARISRKGVLKGEESGREAPAKNFTGSHTPNYDVTGGETELCCRLSPALSIIP